MTLAYPVPQQDRQSDIFVGDGGRVYGPFDFSIFDVGDVEVWTQAHGEDFFSKQPSVLVLKQNDLPLDLFTITFPADQPATTRIVVQSARLDSRSAGVIDGSRIDPTALEKEFSKIATEMQELRRDMNRAWKSDFGIPGLKLDANIVDGDTLMKLGDRLAKGANALDISQAQGYAASAHDDAIAAELARADAVLAAAATGFRVFPDVATAQAANIIASATYIAVALYFPYARFYKRFVADPGGDRFQSADGAWWQGLPLPGTTLDYGAAVQRTGDAALVAGDLDKAHRWTIGIGVVRTVTLPDPALNVGKIVDIGVNDSSRGRLAVAYTTNPIGKFAAGGLFLWAGENMTLIARASEWEILGGRCIPCTLYATAPGPDIGMTSDVTLNLTGWQTALGGTLQAGAEHAINGSGQIVIPRQGFYTMDLDVSFAWSAAPSVLHATAHVNSALNRYFSRLAGGNEVLHPRHGGAFAAGTVLTPSCTATGGTSVGMRATTLGPPQYKLIEMPQW